MRRIYIKLLFCILAFTGCSKEYTVLVDEHLTQNEEVLLSRSGTMISHSWQDQLNFLRDSTPTILAKNGINFLGFGEAILIDSTEQASIIKKSLLEDKNYFPILDDNDQLFLKTKGSILANLEIQGKYDFDMIAKKLDTLITINSFVVNLNWEYNGEIFKSLCILNKDQEFAYDNIISHIIIVEVKETPNLDGELYSIKTTDSIQYKIGRVKSMNSESGGETGGGGGVQGKKDLYKEMQWEAKITSIIGIEQAAVNFTHVATGIGRDGIVEMVGSWVENVRIIGLRSGFRGSIEYRFIEQTTGINGRSYVRVAYFITSKESLQIVWSGSNARIEGEIKAGYSISNITEHLFTAQTGGWRIGNRE